MKLLVLDEMARQTLREMGVFHPHPRARLRAQAILRLSQGVTLQQTAGEFDVHLNSVEQWRRRWNRQGLVGLVEGRHSGRWPKWRPEQQEALRMLAEAEGGSATTLLRHMPCADDLPVISEETARRYLRAMQCSYKRYRYSLKKSTP
jgi:transposase